MTRRDTGNGLSIDINSPPIQRLFSCIGYSAVLTWRSRADAPFDGIYVDVTPFFVHLAGKHELTQSSRLDVPAFHSVTRCPGTCRLHVPNLRRLAAAPAGDQVIRWWLRRAAGASTTLAVRAV